MNCDTLPNTGVNHLGLFLVISMVLIVTGGIALLLARSRRTVGAAALLVVVLSGAGMTVTPVRSAQAATTDCGTYDNSLTITQTSIMAGLAPGIAPAAITGTVVNNGPDSTFISAIDVEILSVTVADARAGACDASDFTLLRARMSVGRAVAPGGSTSFSGAAIGFNDKPTNQDACRNARISLLYTAVSG